MMADEAGRISLVIPTLNRARILEVNLKRHAPLFEAVGCEVVVVDNASTDDTRETVARLQLQFPCIRYIRNEATLSVDDNFIKALKSSRSEYTWLFGDSYSITEEVFGEVYRSISGTSSQLVVLNANGRVKGIPNKVYSDPNVLLAELGWHMTCMACLIFSRTALDRAQYERYRGTDFVQTGVALAFFAENPETRCEWIGSCSVGTLRTLDEQPAWRDRVIKTWALNWVNFVFSLPHVYKFNTKLACVRAHNAHTGVLNLRRLADQKIDSQLSTQVLRQDSAAISLATGLSPRKLWFIASLPTFSLKIARRLFLVVGRKSNSRSSSR